jgi:exodeoxyribonuclease VII small subunit
MLDRGPLVKVNRGVLADHFPLPPKSEPTPARDPRRARALTGPPHPAKIRVIAREEPPGMNKPPKNLKFEQAMEQLDAIVSAMESGKIGIEESIEKYELAMQLAAQCRQILEQAELRIKKIQIDATGGPKTEPFEPPVAAGAESEEEQ